MWIPSTCIRLRGIQRQRLLQTLARPRRVGRHLAVEAPEPGEGRRLRRTLRGCAHVDGILL